MSRIGQTFNILLLLGACDTRVLSKLEEKEANQALVVLKRAGVDATKEKAESSGLPTFHIRVPDQSAVSALRALAKEGIPKKRPQLSRSQNRSILATQTELQEGQRRSLSLSLGQTLESLASVVEARVHLALPLKREWSTSKDPSLAPQELSTEDRASVLLRTREDYGENIDDAGVRRLVAGTVPGLRPENVVVIRVPLAHTKQAKAQQASGGPFSMTKKHATVLRTVLLASLLANLLLAAVFLLRRFRRKH